MALELGTLGRGLLGAPLLYVFLETRDLAAQRALLESGLGLPILEVEPHLPHERHGIIKYDAGDLILSLNLSTSGRFRDAGSDALVMVVDGPAPERLAGTFRLDLVEGRLFTDVHRHHYLFRTAAKGEPTPATVRELRLAVEDLAASVVFYRNLLGLQVSELSNRAARFPTPTADLVLEERFMAIDGRPLRKHTYLLVFHTIDVEGTWSELQARGVDFKSARVGYSDIGGTIRLEDPSGNWLCLYEPSAESLDWGSGQKVRELASRAQTPWEG